MTNPEVQERILAQGFFGRLSLTYPDTVAKKAVDASLRGKFLIVPGWMNKVFRFLGLVVPEAILVRYVARRFSRDEQILAERARRAGGGPDVANA